MAGERADHSSTSSIMTQQIGIYGKAVAIRAVDDPEGAFEKRMDRHHAASRMIADSGTAPAASQHRPRALASVCASQLPDFRAQRG